MCERPLGSCLALVMPLGSSDWTPVTDSSDCTTPARVAELPAGGLELELELELELLWRDWTGPTRAIGAERAAPVS